MHNYKELKVWQVAIDLNLKIYQFTANFPESERFNLILQLRKAVVSIPSNIAEGAGRNSKGDFARFLDIAYGSSCELDTQLIISNKLNYISNEELNSITENLVYVQKMITNLKNSLYR